MNAQSTIMKKWLQDNFKLKKSIFAKNPIAHLTWKISTSQRFGTYAPLYNTLLHSTSAFI